jgi:hypothetical protein
MAVGPLAWTASAMMYGVNTEQHWRPLAEDGIAHGTRDALRNR